MSRGEIFWWSRREFVRLFFCLDLLSCLQTRQSFACLSSCQTRQSSACLSSCQTRQSSAWKVVAFAVGPAAGLFGSCFALGE